MTDLAKGLSEEWRRKSHRIFRLIPYDFAHARLIIIDRNIVYTIGSSVKDMGIKRDIVQQLNKEMGQQFIVDLIGLNLIPESMDGGQ